MGFVIKQRKDQYYCNMPCPLKIKSVTFRTSEMSPILQNIIASSDMTEPRVPKW
jgi:hypothetical protein